MYIEILWLFVWASKCCKVYCCLHLVTWTDTLPICIVQPSICVNYGNSVPHGRLWSSLWVISFGFSVVSKVVLRCFEVWWPLASTLTCMLWLVCVVVIVAAMPVLYIRVTRRRAVKLSLPLSPGVTLQYQSLGFNPRTLKVPVILFPLCHNIFILQTEFSSEASTLNEGILYRTKTGELKTKSRVSERIFSF